MVWAVTAIVASSVVTSAYGAQQAKKRQKKATEQQNVRDLIEGSAPNISNVQEVIVDELQGSDPGALEEALAAMNYQAEGEVPIPGEAGVPSAAGDISQMTEEEAMQLLQEQGGIMGMSRGGPVGTPNDTYYFGVPQIMNMLTDPNPQIQGVGMQLADQMTSTPGMSMVPATRDQIQGMAYGGSVGPKKYDDGGVVADPDPMSQVIKDLLINQIPGVSQARALKDVKEAEGLEKLVEALDLAPINPVKLGRGMKERISARRSERKAAEEEAESRVFGPR